MNLEKRLSALESRRPRVQFRMVDPPEDTPEARAKRAEYYKDSTLFVDVDPLTHPSFSDSYKTSIQNISEGK